VKTVLDVASTTLIVLAVPLVVAGLVELFLIPLAIWAQLRRRVGPVFDVPVPLVSIIVPAYNEEKVIENCLRSIMADQYPNKELIAVDDGSSDGTFALMQRLGDELGITVVSQRNGGKASALNTGIGLSSGEILCMVDADGMFGTTTISELLAGFEHRNVGAVCGNDQPVNLDRLQTRMLALLTHNTAMSRRALARANCLTIVSGNSGAFRRSVVEELGGYHEGTMGEDLELTWRVRLAGYRVEFCPRALVRAEVPSSIRNLWKQRVRWTRGLIQTAWVHRHKIGRTGSGRVGPYLAYNVASMLVMPVIQLVSIPLILLLLVFGKAPFDTDWVGLAAWLGLVNGGIMTVLAVTLDRAWRDLRYLLTAPLWVAFSVFTSLVTVAGIIRECTRSPQRWNKFDRTGVVSTTGTARS
jgi:poly-beta-1,6-N-acetyl-D-glucosamine synthase